MAYVKKPFEELDVLDNFMFNSLTTDPEIKEKFCRRLIKSLLGKEVGKIKIEAEKIIMPDNPEKRGVRLDVAILEGKDGERITNIYDIEPHKDEEKYYAKKNRYLQAQLDKKAMERGDNDFSHVPDLYIINITNYDPFGCNQMVYSIKNTCEEVPELVYNDGVKIYYFNSIGTKGGSQELKIFLKYLVESKNENIVDEATEEIGSYVNQIKRNSQMEGDYVTVGEWMDKIVDEAVAAVTADKDAVIANKDIELAAKDEKLANKDAEIAEYKARIRQLEEDRNKE